MQPPTADLKERQVQEIQGVVLILSSPAMVSLQSSDLAETFDLKYETFLSQSGDLCQVSQLGHVMYSLSELASAERSDQC